MIYYTMVEYYYGNHQSNDVIQFFQKLLTLMPRVKFAIVKFYCHVYHWLISLADKLDVVYVEALSCILSMKALSALFLIKNRVLQNELSNFLQRRAR